MHTLTLKTSAIGAWIMAIIYDWIEVNTGFDFKLLLYAAIATLAIGLYVSCTENNKTAKEEA